MFAFAIAIAFAFAGGVVIAELWIPKLDLRHKSATLTVHSTSRVKTPLRAQAVKKHK